MDRETKMKCKLLGCKRKERLRSDKFKHDSEYCCEEHSYIDSHRYSNETLQEFLKRIKTRNARRNNKKTRIL